VSPRASPPGAVSSPTPASIVHDRTYTVATAGHVDHGKSTLVRVLTGIDPDRLKEEQARQMTIDLGFAWFDLPTGESVGVVDVPGHEDFIENMLAGVGGIDAVLFVIAADEGVRPQTREHAEILGLLGVTHGVVALTKSDLVSDAAWLELVMSEAAEALNAAGLPDLPMFPVSGLSGEGLGSLVEGLAQALANAPRRIDHGRPRLSIDRVFTMEGFGTVVTGTLTDGSLNVGDDVVLGPGIRKARGRGLQSHKQKVSNAAPGGRLAVNLAGIDADQVGRGDVLMLQGSYLETTRLDARLAMVSRHDVEMRHGEQIKVFHRSSRRLGRVRMLEADLLGPGDEVWAQLELESALLRRPSPPETLAAATIVQLQSSRRYRRRDSEVLRRLERISAGGAEARLIQASKDLGPASPVSLFRAAGLEVTAGQPVLDELTRQGTFLVDRGEAAEGEFALASEAWSALWTRAHSLLSDYESRYPLRAGMPREELRSRLEMDRQEFQFLVRLGIRDGRLEVRGGLIARKGFVPVPSDSQRLSSEGFLAEMRARPASPPSLKQARELLGEEVVAHLIEQGSLVRVSQDVVFDRETYAWMVEEVRRAIEQHGQVSVADVRDRMNTSRKYALALLEHLDDIGVTVRQGDVRTLKA
jgi:selenocysteine-specific elongation factor